MKEKPRPRTRAKLAQQRPRQTGPGRTKIDWDADDPVLGRVFDAWLAESKADGKGMTVGVVARQISVSRQALAAVLRSKRGPELARLRGLAEAMGMTFRQLAGRIEAADPEHNEVLR
jgi:transcriptional regulator with XRE-family HTH domain